MKPIICGFVVVLLLVSGRPLAADDNHPLSPEVRAALKKSLEESVEAANKVIEKDPKSVDGYSARGNFYFYLGRFKESVADYRKMLELDPTLEQTLEQTHWRLGLALYYVDDFKGAQRLFEKGYEVDKVDRENGIWKYLSQAKAEGIDKAKKDLPVYTEFDRHPLPSVYKLFSDEITPAEILKEIDEAKVNPSEREKRLFYANLYIGLNHLIRGDEKSAIEPLRLAVANKWGQQGRGGPNYMWHLGRVQYDLLTAKQDAAKTEKK